MSHELLLEEALRVGAMWSRVVRRGQSLRVVDVEGGATPALLVYATAVRSHVHSHRLVRGSGFGRPGARP